MTDRFFDATIAVTINGVTKEILFTVISSGNRETAFSKASFGAYQKRPGTKVWANEIRLCKQIDEDSWKLATTTTIMNRSGYRLVGWASEISQTSKHNSAHTPR